MSAVVALFAAPFTVFGMPVSPGEAASILSSIIATARARSIN